MPNSSIDIFNDRINNTLNIIQRENKFCYFLKHLNIDLFKYEEHRLTSEFLDLINEYNVYPLTSKPRYDSHSTHSSSWVTVGILVRSCLLNSSSAGETPVAQWSVLRYEKRNRSTSLRNSLLSIFAILAILIEFYYDFQHTHLTGASMEYLRYARFHCHT